MGWLQDLLFYDVQKIFTSILLASFFCLLCGFVLSQRSSLGSPGLSLVSGLLKNV